MLELTDVGLWLPRRGVLFEHLDVRVAPGEIVLVTGQNGCGTTQVLRSVVGEGEPGARRVGTIRWGRLDLGQARIDDFGDSLAWLPERPPTGALTVRELLRRHVGSASAGDVEVLVDRLGLRDLLDTSLRRAGGSAAQRALLASSLLQSPRLLLCDQLLAPLETTWRIEVCALLRERADAGLAVLWADHELSEAVQAADTVVELGARHPVHPAARWRPETLPWTPLQQVSAALGEDLRSVAEIGARLRRILPGSTTVAAPTLRRDHGSLTVQIADRPVRVPELGITVIACRDAQAVESLRRSTALGNRLTHPRIRTASPVKVLARQADRRLGLAKGSTLARLQQLIPTLRPEAALDVHSAGERARCLLELTGSGQPVRLLAEPMRYLDHAAREAVLSRWGRESTACLLVSTDAEAVTYADRVLVCDGTDVLADGSATAVIDALPELPALARACAPSPFVRPGDVLAVLPEVAHV